MLRGVDGWEGEHFAFGEAEASTGAAPTSVTIGHGADGPTATIPDAHLLFTAQFARAGADLVLHGEDGKAFVVHDYFATDDHARLLSPEGAALSAEIVAALVGPQAPGQYAQAGAAPAAAQAVGRIAQADSDATIVRNGVAVAAHAGDAVLKGDVLQTVSGTVGVTFNDGSTLNLTANTRMVVNEFIYDPKGSANSQLLDLVQGSLTFISGEVAHTGNMSIGTPVATMGIRGTVGGVTSANDGTVRFYVSQSATGAVILDSRGTIIANVVQDGPMVIVRPTGPLQVLAEEVQKTPAQMALELAALQQILNIKSIGDQILQQNQTPDPNATPNPQSTDKPLTQFQTYEITLKPGTPDAGNHDPNTQPFVTATITETTPKPDGTPPGHIDVVIPPHVNVAPILDFFNVALTEGGTRILSVSDFHVTDPDSSSFVFTVSNVSGGTFQIWHEGTAQHSAFGFAAFDTDGHWTVATSFTADDIAAGHVRFVSDGGEAAPTFSIVVSDYLSGSAAVGGSVAFTSVNDAPVATPIVLEVTEGHAPVTIDGLDGAYDPDAGDTLHVDPLTVVLSSSDGHNNALPHLVNYTANGSSITIDPAQFKYLGAGEEAVLVATYDVVDSSGARVETSATLTVTGVNDAPLATPIVLQVSEDHASITIDGLDGAHDPDANDTLHVDPLTVVLSSSDGDGQPLSHLVNYTANGSAITIDPAQFNYLGAGEEAVLRATYDVVDSSGARVHTSATVTVTGVNDAPVITSNGGGSSAILFVAENTTAITTVHATDVDGPDVSYSIVGGADSGKFAINAATGVLTFIAAQNFEHPSDSNHNGFYTVQVGASDGSLTDVQTLNVGVTNVNEAPRITSGEGDTASVSMSENHRSVTTVHVSDPDFLAFTRYSIVTGSDSPDAGKFTINPFTGELSFKEAPNYEHPTDAGANNSYVVKVKASDGSLSDTQIITVTVNNVNEAPVIDGASSLAVDVAENTTAVTTVHATDVDSAAITYSIAGGADAAKFAIDSHTGELSFVSAPDYETRTDADQNGTYTVQVQASDDGSLTDTQTVNVHVTNVNEAPAFAQAAYNFSTVENTPPGTVVGTVHATDADNDALTYSIVSGNGDHVFAIDNSGNIIVTGVLDYQSAGRDLVVASTDSAAHSDEASVHVSIQDVNEPSNSVLTSSAGVSISATQYGATNGFVLPGAGNVTTPGTPEDRITFAYDRDGGHFLGNSAPMLGVFGFGLVATASYAAADGNHFTTVLSAGPDVTLSQTIILASDANYFTTVIDVYNGGDSDITGARFMRNFDPDQDQITFGSFYTYNDVIQNPSASSTVAAVSATGQYSGAKVVLVGSDGDWHASSFGFSNSDPFDPSAFDSPVDPNGQLGDTAISLTNALSTIDAGGHAEISFITTANVATTGANALVGTQDANTIDGHGGNDVLFGLNGADAFVFKGGYGKATIADFSGHGGQGDHIDLYDVGYSSFAALSDNGHIQDIDRGGGIHDTLIDLGGGDAVTLQHVNYAALAASDFIFHSTI